MCSTHLQSQQLVDTGRSRSSRLVFAAEFKARQDCMRPGLQERKKENESWGVSFSDGVS